MQTFFHTTTRDTALGGVAIPEGEKVLMLLGAANRDPRKWPEPDGYDIDRSTAAQVGFGAGRRVIAGAARGRGVARRGRPRLFFARAGRRADALFYNRLHGWRRMRVRATAA